MLFLNSLRSQGINFRGPFCTPAKHTVFVVESYVLLESELVDLLTENKLNREDHLVATRKEFSIRQIPWEVKQPLWRALCLVKGLVDCFCQQLGVQLAPVLQTISNCLGNAIYANGFALHSRVKHARHQSLAGKPHESYVESR